MKEVHVVIRVYRKLWLGCCNCVGLIGGDVEGFGID